LEIAGLHGMRVLWFERNGHEFSPPDAWDHEAVAMTSTHDLPTVAGWWHGKDIARRAECGRLGVGVNEADVAAERATDRGVLWQAFVRAGAADGDVPPAHDTQPAVDAALTFVASTSAPICIQPIEDLIGVEEQPNLPGTIDEHPNWRRRLTANAGELLDEPHTAERVARLAARRPRL
jgi:4-alpha-glucanotransferase